jgi:hypothetical protein
MPRRPAVPLTPEQRSLRSRIAGHQKWANTENPSAATEPARKAFMARFEREVDPNNELAPTERARRAEHARKAYFARLALASARARSTRTPIDEAKAA